MIADYEKAKKLGEKEYRRAVARGEYPFLPSLEEMVKEVDRYPEVSLPGTAEIPLDMIAGTRRTGRQNSFAANFMPLMKEDTEFAAKWSNLIDSQVEEGIRDPIKAYEFLNRFYVEEGNKRVSVMRFVGAVSIPARITRILPPRTDSYQSRLYYEYLEFYKSTGMFEITLSTLGSYGKLARILEQPLGEPWPEELLEKLHAGFVFFRTTFLGRGGGRLSCTPGDAFLIYMGVYSLDSLSRESTEEVGRRITRLWREFALAGRPDSIALIENRDAAAARGKKNPIEKAAEKAAEFVEKTGAASLEIAADQPQAADALLGGLGLIQSASSPKTAQPSPTDALLGGLGLIHSRHDPLRIAFFHEKDADRSGWTYAHELGRLAVAQEFGSRVETIHFDDCADPETMREAVDTAQAEGCRLLFATAPCLQQPILRYAVDHPEARALCCSFNQTGKALRFYYGKMFEAKYLMGALAASLTDDHRIRYLAGRADSAAVSNINAFALGAQLIDPYCRIELEWIGAGPRNTSHCLRGRLEKGRIHVISDIDMVRIQEEDRMYGLYLMDDDGAVRRLAAPLWDWGVLYKLIVRRILDGTYDSTPDSQKDRSLNYWMGLSSGLVDIILSDRLPRPSYRLMSTLRRGIESGAVHPFAGPIPAQDGTEHGKEGASLTAAEIMGMDWLCGNVDGTIENAEP